MRLLPAQPSSHPVDVGLRTEAYIISELARRGYTLLLPWGVNQRYDLVLDLNGEFLRCQCKTGRLRHGVVRFATRSVRSNTKRTFFRGYQGEIELFLVYCPETERIYAVPVDEVREGDGFLRVEPTRNGQLKNVRWAHEYELPG